MDKVPDVPLPPGNDLAVVREWALTVMASFDLAEWEFTFTRGKRTLGVCYSIRQVIGLSVYLVQGNDKEVVRDVLLHEISHALTPGHGHDEVWKAMCREIGCRPVRCCNAPISVPAGRWRATCGCGKTFRRYRRPQRMTGWFCKRCGRVRGALVWKQIGKEA